MTTEPLREVERAAALLFRTGDVVEVRIPGATRAGTISGYYDDRKLLIQHALFQEGKGQGVYWTLNPVNPALRARAHNRIKEWAKNTTTDSDIVSRRWLPLDFDSVRPAGISSTDREHALAIERATACRQWLCEQDWPGPILADSGNGAHLLYPIDLPNDDAATDLIRACLGALSRKFTDGLVSLDLKTFNAARIWKVYGSVAAKGDPLPERPHRRARILEVPDAIALVRRELLEVLAGLTDAGGVSPNGSVKGADGPGFDLEGWIRAHGLNVGRPESYQDGRKWRFTTCPFNSDHQNGSAFLIQFGSGAIIAGCHHHGCAGKGWHDLRDQVEPGWQQSGTDGREARQPGLWPDPLAAEAFYGLAGETVRLIEPHTEADPAALLLQFLVIFGNVIGRTAHFVVDGVKHFLVLFVVLDGLTSKSRKGTSWAHILNVFSGAYSGTSEAAAGPIDLTDPSLRWIALSEWARDCVQGGLASGEGLIWAVRDRVSDEDPGVNEKRLLVHEPEFARVLRVCSRDGNILSATIRQAWDSGTLRVMTKNTPAKATDAHISIVGHITTQELLRSLTATDQANGFANRFLWVCAKRSRLLPDGGKLDKTSLAPVSNRLLDAIEFARTVGEMYRDEQARSLWHEVYPRLSKERPGLCGAVTGRAEAQTMRLACLYALLSCSNVIRQEHLRAALAVWRYCEDSARFIFGDALGDSMAEEIAAALRAKPEGMTRTELSALFRRHKSASDIERALHVLLDHGLARYQNEDTGGRKVERWFSLTNT